MPPPLSLPPWTRRAALVTTALLGLAGCAHRAQPSQQDINTTGWALASGVWSGRQVLPPQADSQWYPFLIPGKRETLYQSVVQGVGQDALAVHAKSSASMLRRKIQVPGHQLGRTRFSWKVQDLIAQGDMADKDLDDAPVRIVFAFDGDRSLFSAKNAMLSELSHALTGEPMPYAVLMYVWSKHRPVGTVIPSPRTDRIRKLVVESGPARLGQWTHFERDLRADFMQLFGEAPGTLSAMGVMTDTDNTRTTVDALYGPLTIEASSK